MNKYFPAIILLILSAAIYLGTSQKGQKETHETEVLTREEVDHDFGTQPNKVFHPKLAIDTDIAPSIALKEGNEGVLHTYEVAKNTYLFYGNIAEVDENNRGYNGNAGFIVTADSVVVIDSLGTPALGRRMIKTIASITDKPIKYLIFTHISDHGFYNRHTLDKLHFAFNTHACFADTIFFIFLIVKGGLLSQFVNELLSLFGTERLKD